MKAVNRLKKINPGVLQTLAIIIIAAVFAFVLFHHYQLFNQYQSSKAKKKQEKTPQTVQFNEIKPPALTGFIPPKGKEESYNLFAFNKNKDKKPDKSGSPNNPQPINPDAPSGEYRILGVAKRGQLLVIVRFNKDKKIRAFKKGEYITKNKKIADISTNNITIIDETGREQIFKVFTYEYKKLNIKDKKKKK